MSGTWNITELNATIAAMQKFKNRCNELLQLIDSNTRRANLSEIRRLYTELKSDLKSASKYGTLSGKREVQSLIESAFYDPAVRKAHLALRPAINSNPWNSEWFGAIYEAEMEFSDSLGELERILKKCNETLPSR